MIGCNEDVIGERLRQLLAACNETAALAVHFATQAQVEPLRMFLRERSDDYRRAGYELAAYLQTLPQAPIAHGEPAALGVARGPDIASAWEAAECDALILLRDALDAELPANAEEVVIRHIEEGVRALERLRELRRQVSAVLGGSRSRRFVAS